MHFPLGELQSMATDMAASVLFKQGKEQRPLTPQQILSLLLMAQADGKHPAAGVRDYDIVNGRPAKKTEAMLRDFIENGGKVEWHNLSDIGASATFSHPQGGSIKIDWDIVRATKAGLIGKDVWQKYRRNMMRARVVSEGVRTVFPAATSSVPATEEAQDFSQETPKPLTVPVEPLEALAERLAAEVAVSTNLEATWSENAPVIARMESERPEWVPLMQSLFEKRNNELRAVPSSNINI